MAFTEDYARHFVADLEGWQDTIQAYPDRFMWGTDRGGPAVWTYGVAVGLRLADYARAFIRCSTLACESSLRIATRSG